MKDRKQKNQWDKEFKINAVNLYRDSNKTFKETEEVLGIPHGNVNRWNRALKEEEVNADTKNPRLTTKDEEILRLKKEVIELRQEREVLKKSVAIFLKPQK